MTAPNARQMLADHGIPANVIDGILTIHAHQLAEHLRAGAASGQKSGLTRIYYRAADDIDPQAQTEPLALLRAIEEAPRYELVPGCPTCPDGRTPPAHGQTWSAWLANVQDGDGQPMQITVARSAGAHVAESDAEWLRTRLNASTD
ncbi:hypothetical protein [Actinacidiphila glaucinigra]|uniref:hypothetical protein n=1 Tax=Actinacidiphila glaucinigra TaxID=235986 RepID=UPI00371213E9